MLVEGLRLGVPVIVGSAGGSGAAPHLAWCRSIIEEIAREERLSFTMAVISADVPTQAVMAALRAGRIHPLAFVPALTEEAIDASTHIVAQMGSEPLVRSLDAGAQVVLAGRCYDPACFAAAADPRGFRRGPGPAHGEDPRVRRDRRHAGQRGRLRLRHAVPRQVRAGGAEPPEGVHPGVGRCPHAVREIGPLPASRSRAGSSTSRPAPSPSSATGGWRCGEAGTSGPRRYRVKLEGARRVGYRSISIAGTRDPMMVARHRCDPRGGARTGRRDGRGEVPRLPALPRLREGRGDGPDASRCGRPAPTSWAS